MTQIEKMFFLLNKLKQYDYITYQHSIDTGGLVLKFMEFYNIQNRDLYIGALLHDIGKLKIPLEIIQKLDRLTSTEYQLMKKHIQYGYSILYKEGFNKTIQNIALLHHERINGTGYLCKKKQSIPYEAKLIAIADCFSAMTGKRQYQEPKSFIEALSDIEQNAGTLFDEELAIKFINIIKKHIKTSERMVR